MRGQITNTQIPIDAAHRRSIAARSRANDAPVFNDGPVFNWPWAQNPVPEQQEDPGNVATECQVVPLRKALTMNGKHYLNSSYDANSTAAGRRDKARAECAAYWRAKWDQDLAWFNAE